MVLDQYDLVIIGIGTAAMVAAIASALPGGVWRSPTTGLSAVPAPYAAATRKRCLSAVPRPSTTRMQGNGAAGDVHIDWPELIAFKRTFTDPVPEKHEHRYDERVSIRTTGMRASQGGTA